MTDRLWGIADLACRDCRGLVGLESAELSPDDPNLAGKSALHCLSCGLRRPVRDLPVGQQGLIVERLRRLLVEDEFTPVADAWTGFLEGRPGTPVTRGNLQHRQDRRSQPPQPTEAVSALPGSTGERLTPVEEPTRHAIGSEVRRSDVAGTRESRSSSAAQRGRRDKIEFAMCVKMSREEVELLAKTLVGVVGQVMPNRRSKSTFSAVRLRRPYFDTTSNIEIYSYLSRKTGSGRTNNIGFSLDEVMAIAAATKSKDDEIVIRDTRENVVGMLKVERAGKGTIGTMSLWRPRQLPSHLRV